MIKKFIIGMTLNAALGFMTIQLNPNASFITAIFIHGIAGVAIAMWMLDDEPLFKKRTVKIKKQNRKYSETYTLQGEIK